MNKDEDFITCAKFTNLAPIKSDLAKMELKLKRTVEDKDLRLFKRYADIDLSFFIYLHTLARKLTEAVEVAHAHSESFHRMRAEFQAVYLQNMENILASYKRLITDAYIDTIEIPALHIQMISAENSDEVHLLNTVYQFEKAYRDYELPTAVETL